MGANNEIEIRNNFNKALTNIQQLNSYLDNFDEEIQFMEDKALLFRLYKYILKYQKFEGIKRFSIPVIGCANCGKSTILNYSLNLNDILETSFDITTKFITIIRHNEELKGKSPRIYNVKIVQRAYINNKFLYSFEKDGDYLKGDAKEIIKKRNQLIANDEAECIPENYFYILETYIPFFDDEKIKIYSNYFEFMDIPGLNEDNSNKNKEDIYFKKLLPLFINNIKFSVFIFDTTNYEDGKTDVLYNFEKKLNSFYEIYKNDILKEKIHNSIIVLNKIDKSNLEGGIEEEKKNFENHVKTNLKINIEENFICYLNAKREKYLRNRFIDFDKYLAYIKCIIKDKNKKFLDELIKNMNKDFNINIKESFDEEDEENTFLLNNKYLKSEGFTDEINSYDYKYYKNIYEKNLIKIFKRNNETIFEKNLKKAFKKVYEDFIINNEENEQLFNDILKNFEYKNKQYEEGNKNIKNTNNINIKNYLEKENYLKHLKKIGILYEELKNLEPEHVFMKTIYNNYKNKKNYIENNYKYTIAVLGNYSTGKSSLLNSLIGIDLIPCSSNLCTKIVLIIQYTNEEEDIALYKANFQNQNDTYNLFIKGELLIKGKNCIKETLKEKNKSYIEGEISYYILSTPIKYLDNFIEDENIKKRVQFIDLPGFNVLEDNEEKKMFSNLIEYINLFLFTNYGNIVLSKENKLSIFKTLDLIMERKNYSNSIMFILNLFDNLETKNDDEIRNTLEKFKKDINGILTEYKSLDWDRHINIYSKIMKNDDMLYSYFSPKEHTENQKIINTMKLKVQNFKNYIKAIAGDTQLEPNDLIKKIKKNLKEDYINKLYCKKDFNEKTFNLNENDNKISNYKNFLINFLKLNEEQCNENKNNIDCIIKRYCFIRESIYNNDFKYKDFLTKLKNKIIKEILISPKLISLRLFFDLNKYLSFISQNIINYKSKDFKNNIEDLSNNFVKIYDFHKKNINEKFEKTIENLKNILYEIATEQNDASKKFKSEIEGLYDFVENIFRSYIKKMKRENESIIKRADIIIDTINLIEDKNFVYNTYFESFYTIGFLSTSLLGGLILGISSYTSAGILGSMFAFLIGAGLCEIPTFIVGVTIYFLIKGISKLINVNKRNKKIEEETKEINNILTKYKKNILNQMENLYKTFKENIDELILSLKYPMVNIAKNEKEFLEIKNKFNSYLKKLNK